MAQIRCINIDWLEVYCLEPADELRDTNYYIQKGYQVHQRDYGTPIYKEMFFIVDEGHQFIEIRRKPRKVKSQGGVSDDHATHIRLCNRTCYLKNPVQIMQEFLLANGYQFKSLSRIDIALDFQQFDDGTEPKTFVERFMTGDLQKLNQANIAAHGRDAWQLRVWDSLKWGAPTSAVTTKMYNKTLELKETKDKPYIREIWAECGFEANKDVWRVEFSINANSNAIIDKETGDYIKRSLNSFLTKDNQYYQFCCFAAKYFHFKIREYTREGNIKPKGRCKDFTTFIYQGNESFYVPTRLTWKPEGGRTEKLLAKRLDAIRFDDTLTPKVREAAAFLFGHMAERYNIKAYCANLEVAMTCYVKDNPDFYEDFATLHKINQKWQLPDVKPKPLSKSL